jgi:spermidine/putrescine-binding protein
MAKFKVAIMTKLFSTSSLFIFFVALLVMDSPAGAQAQDKPLKKIAWGAGCGAASHDGQSRRR